MTTDAKCTCRNCNGSIVFPAEMAGSTADCPYCKMETILFIPPPSFAPKATPAIPKVSRSNPAKPPANLVEDWLELLGRGFLIFGVVAAFVCGLVLFENLISDEKGESPVTILFAGLAFLGQGFVLWILFRALAEIIRLLRKISPK